LRKWHGEAAITAWSVEDVDLGIEVSLDKSFNYLDVARGLLRQHDFGSDCVRRAEEPGVMV
jgi:hypothetical protein